MKEKNEVKVAISNHHVHLTKEAYEFLFYEPIVAIKDLKQKGEFAATQMVTIKGPEGEINRVRVIGPFRDYNQVEITRSDAHALGIELGARKSGDLHGSRHIMLAGSKAETTLLEGCIIAKRHIHMNEEDAKRFNVKDGDIVSLIVDNEKGGTMDAYVKVSENGVLEAHIDYDDANAFLLKNGDVISFELKEPKETKEKSKK